MIINGNVKERHSMLLIPDTFILTHTASYAVTVKSIEIISVIAKYPSHAHTLTHMHTSAHTLVVNFRCLK